MVARKRRVLVALSWLVNAANVVLLGASIWAIAGNDNKTFNAITVIASLFVLAGSNYLTWAEPQRVMERVFENCKKMAVLMTRIEQDIATNRVGDTSALTYESEYQTLIGDLQENHLHSDYAATKTGVTFSEVLIYVITTGIVLAFFAMLIWSPRA